MNIKTDKKLSSPRQLCRGKENKTINAISSVSKKNKNFELEQQLRNVSNRLQEMINDSNNHINSILNEIARSKNDCEKMKLGFSTRLLTQKHDQKLKFNAKIADIQTKANLELAEKEKFAKTLEQFSKELEELQKPQKIPQEEIKIDFSQETQEIINKKEKEIFQECTSKISPLFEKVQKEHNQNIENLTNEYKTKLESIEKDSGNINEIYLSKSSASKEERALKQKYETLIENEKKEFEQKRDELKKKIQTKQQERDKDLQKIIDEIDETIFNEENQFKKEIETLKNSIPEIDVKFSIPSLEITNEQLEQFKKNVIMKFDSDFKVELQKVVDEMAIKRENFRKQMPFQEKKEILDETRENHRKIETLHSQINDLENNIKSIKEKISSEKAEWSEMNTAKRLNKESLVEFQKKSELMSNQIESIQEEIESYEKIDASFVDEVLSSMIIELEDLQKQIKISRRKHQLKINTIQKRHEKSVKSIKNRVESLIRKKNEQILVLKQKIKSTNAQKAKLKTIVEQKLKIYENIPVNAEKN